MNRPEFQQILEQAWKRGADLSAAKNLPQAERDRLAEEIALTKLLGERPRTPVSSNFTARVLNEVQRKQKSRRKRSWWVKLPRIALGFASIAVAIGISVQYKSHKRAEEIAAVSSLATMPKMEWLRDYEAIDRLNALTADDHDVLIVLNQR